MNTAATKAYVEKKWPEVQKSLMEAGRIPNQSIDYDEDYFRNGLYEKCMKLHMDYIKRQNIQGLKMEVVKGGPSMASCLFVEVEGTDKSGETILMYGHLDKQPPLTDDWTKTKPYDPKIMTTKYGEGIFGRGIADDQYSTFCGVTAIQAVKAQKLPHPRFVMLFENEEESGSPHIKFFVEKLQSKIGQPRLVICMDSGGGDYNRLWLTTSLRGLVSGTIRAKMLRNGVHSGGSGVVRDAFHTIRVALDRLEDATTGEMKVPELFVKCPAQFEEAIERTTKILGEEIWSAFPFLEGVEPQEPRHKLMKLFMNKTWRPQLTITGVDGIPDLKGGNVVREFTAVKISIRIPPTANHKACLEAVSRTITEKPYPMGAKVTFEDKMCCPGFGCPVFDPWLQRSLNEASLAYYGNPAAHYGEGGSIPFMDFLQKKFKKAQFMVVGLIGPESNAHAPDEYMNIAMCKGLMCSVASVIVDASNAYCGKSTIEGGLEQKAIEMDEMMKSVEAGMQLPEFTKAVLVQLADLKDQVKRLDSSMDKMKKQNASLGAEVKKLKYKASQKSELLQTLIEDKKV